jgi:hypothetical protein
MQSNPQLQIGGILAQGTHERSSHFPGVLEAAGGEAGANDGVLRLWLGQTCPQQYRRRIILGETSARCIEKRCSNLPVTAK